MPSKASLMLRSARRARLEARTTPMERRFCRRGQFPVSRLRRGRLRRRGNLVVAVSAASGVGRRGPLALFLVAEMPKQYYVYILTNQRNRCFIPA